MRPDPGQVLHFSEDPTITRFVPHVAATAQQSDAYVWAVDHDRAPDYWFPRRCPRAMAWVCDATSEADRERIMGSGCGDRVHAIEYGWLEAIRQTRLYAYRLPAEQFRPFGMPEPHAHVSVETVEPLGPAEPVGDLLQCHAEAGIQLRVLDNLWPFWDAVITSTVAFSGIRLRNARHHPKL
ncbi:hypothetical protein I0C86_20080 [Plantactinospora sp. S1510]|uniref:Uncharacterized protein n=1 Tax=Plantactinospora alkalitolerans TaxID=2789879 RepID=A0ABS0GYH1_9ACTN|nr:DUF6886 family protein [Plantactinospora alkalitolerans]MBF9131242.1 hypothetical protein [Plantactinospora alkalitolerans]